jgi:transcriptional regulator with XRE-family HTH domain
MKTEERALARRLRREEGLSVKHIARRLGVSTSSVSRWIRDIPLTEEQHQALIAQCRKHGAQLRGARANADRGRARRRGYQADGRALARLREPLHVAGTMLYWAEGDKSNLHQARLVNADPELLRVFLGYLRTFFHLSDERVTITCHLFADHLVQQQAHERYWLDALGLPSVCLRRSVVNAYSRSSQGKRRRMLPHGTCRVAVNETRVLQSIFGAIQEYGGFERPEWLG